MKKIVYTKYGSPDVLQSREVALPIPKDDEVLIQMHATTVTAVDSFYRRGNPLMARLDAGLIRPKKYTLGTDLAGEIKAVGNHVTRFKKGDRVFGSTCGGAHAEYICLSDEGAVAIKPANMTFEEAAAVPYGASTALHFLRDAAKIQRGQRVLINGASGSIGSFAVQLAKYFGAQVTGVCSTVNLEWVKSLGADSVIDYTKEDFRKRADAYDIVFDTVGKSSYSHCKGSLTQRGVYLTTVPSLAILLQMLWTSKIGGKKAMIAFAGMRSRSKKTKDLNFLTALIEAGNLESIIDRHYPLEQIAEAHGYVDKGHKKGNVVITVGRSKVNPRTRRARSLLTR